MRTLSTFTLLAGFCVASAAAAADDTFTVAFKNHRIVPAELEVPAGRKIKLVVENQDPTPEEFESYSLNREKVIPGNTSTIIYVGPLKPGQYDMFGDFNQATAQGRIVAR